MTYRANTAIGEIVNKTKEGEAEYDFTSEDGIRHRVFVISGEPEIAAIRDVFEKLAQFILQTDITARLLR